jgi:hypothetical protein
MLNPVPHRRAIFFGLKKRSARSTREDGCRRCHGGSDGAPPALGHKDRRSRILLSNRCWSRSGHRPDLNVPRSAHITSDNSFEAFELKAEGAQPMHSVTSRLAAGRDHSVCA